MRSTDNFDYTTSARSFAFRFPLLTRISIQVNYWTLAFLLLGIVMHLNTMSINSAHQLGLPLTFLPSFWASIILGVSYGTLLGLWDWRVDKILQKNFPMGLVILISSVWYIIILIGMLFFLRYVIWERFMLAYFYEPDDFNLTEDSWRFISYMFSIYALVLAPGISFINLMNKKFGPGVLLPLLMGKYRRPQNESRLFMFMDLRSSTTHAENLGHIKYSALIRDCFGDINQALVKYKGEIYQYVGDEMVINWLMISHFDPVDSINFFFDVQEGFISRQDYYLSNYNIVPEFKAGIHMGMVTAVEVGDIKREIAYHGDTINTASRIQDVCNTYGENLLISSDVANSPSVRNTYHVKSMGSLALRGKEQPTEIFGVTPREQ